MMKNIRENWIETMSTVSHKHGYEVLYIPNDPRREGLEVIEVYFDTRVEMYFGAKMVRIAVTHISFPVYEYIEEHGCFKTWLDLWLGACNHAKQLEENR